MKLFKKNYSRGQISTKSIKYEYRWNIMEYKRKMTSSHDIFNFRPMYCVQDSCIRLYTATYMLRCPRVYGASTQDDLKFKVLDSDYQMKSECMI
jgi:hypothetical protein